MWALFWAHICMSDFSSTIRSSAAVVKVFTRAQTNPKEKKPRDWVSKKAKLVSIRINVTLD